MHTSYFSIHQEIHISTIHGFLHTSCFDDILFGRDLPVLKININKLSFPMRWTTDIPNINFLSLPITFLFAYSYYFTYGITVNCWSAPGISEDVRRKVFSQPLFLQVADLSIVYCKWPGFCSLIL